MVSEKMMPKLKQSNISVDREKTKERVNILWKTSTKAQKNTIRDIADISRATIYRVYNTGNVSAKIVAPISEVLNVDPNYLIGKTDHKGECSEEILTMFLANLGYTKESSNTAKGRRSYNKRSESQTTVELQVNTETLTLSDLYLLMQSLLLKEKAGNPDALAKAAQLRALLIS